MHRFSHIFHLFSLFLICCDSFNIDVSSPKEFSGTSGEQFGYAVALHRAENTYWALVGAPNSDKTGTLTQKMNGAVYRCPLSSSGACINMAVDDIVARGNENKTKQMMGATLLSMGHNEKIVACAPRFMDTPDTKVWLHGRCFLVDGKAFSPSRIIWNPCKSQKQGNVNFGYCGAGISAAVSERIKKFLILGMPGVQQGVGRLGLQDISKIIDGSTGAFPYTSADRLKQNTMMGYAVSWGQFSGSTYGDMVGGAPKGSGGKGKVLIYKLSGYIPVQAVIENTDTTMAVGSYFGSVICVVDLNNDGKSDLLVGAPLYTVFEDEGKVYVYTTDAKGAVNLKGALTGEKTVKGKFGSAISSVGDLNKDGFLDIAIGAPYGGPDGKGAVYIYHGSKDGIGNNMQYVQKIYAADIAGKPTSFGHAISGSVDVDVNKYPDIVVGSYESNKAHVFKTRSILKMTGSLQPNTTKVAIAKVNSSLCKVVGIDKYQCVEVRFCMTYSGEGTPAEIDLAIKLDLDKDQVGGKRAMTFNGSVPQITKNITERYQFNTKKCINEVVYVKENVLALLSPIVIGVTYDYKKPAGGCTNNLCPIADMYTSRALSTEITYLKDCGADDICDADLVINAVSVLPKGYQELVFGLVDTYTLKINVENKGENAFLARMHIDFPDDLSAVGVQFVNEPNPLWDRQILKDGKNGTVRIEFSLDSPFVFNHKLEILVKFTPAKPRPRAKILSISVNATTVSKEVNPKDNFKIVTVDAALLADLTVSGSANPDKLFYGKEKNNETKDFKHEREVGPVITYKYLIQNRGPSPVQEVYGRVSLVTKHKDKWIAMLFSAKIDGSNACELKGRGNPLNLTLADQKNEISKARKRRDTSSSIENAVDLNCRSATCITFDCYIGSINKGDSKTMELRTRLFQNTFIEEKRPMTKLTSIIAVEILGEEKNFLRQPVGHKPDKVEVSILVSPPVSTSQKKGKPIDWWIIFLAVLGALLLIVGVVLVLWKVGFFERKLKGKKISGPTEDFDELQ